MAGLRLRQINVFRSTQYEYDNVGNRAAVIAPKGVVTTTVTDDFRAVTVYDALNRIKETLAPYDPSDERCTTATKTTYGYDEVGRLASVSTPGYGEQSTRNTTSYTYFDHGLVKTSTDQWGIATGYDHNELGQQTKGT